MQRPVRKETSVFVFDFVYVFGFGFGFGFGFRFPLSNPFALDAGFLQTSAFAFILSISISFAI